MTSRDDASGLWHGPLCKSAADEVAENVTWAAQRPDDILGRLRIATQVIAEGLADRLLHNFPYSLLRGHDAEVIEGLRRARVAAMDA